MEDNFYLNKYGFCPPQLHSTISTNTSMIVVIPCYNEPNPIETLSALKKCDPTHSDVEVIIVINASENDVSEIISNNNQSQIDIENWISFNSTDKLKFHLIANNSLPKKHAGVGLARKIGMDEAVSRFHQITKDGIIVCFDADSLCDENYLVEIEKHFISHPNATGCSIYYEHPISGTDFPKNIYEGITQYELFLRYYNQGLRYAGLPYAFHTVGSSMAVRSSAYQKQGGMNKRKAGEDFYFLHKIIELGGFTELNSTRVIPSPRSSDRVPFGTGRAIGEWLSNNDTEYKAYSLNSFEDIKTFISTLFDLYEETNPEMIIEHQSFILKEFLKANDFYIALEVIKTNSASYKSFRKRFFRWFNAFMVLKFMHYARDEYYPNISILEVTRNLLYKTNSNTNSGMNSPEEVLTVYREIERKQ